jgi:hypothetical protein
MILVTRYHIMLNLSDDMAQALEDMMANPLCNLFRPCLVARVLAVACNCTGKRLLGKAEASGFALLLHLRCYALASECSL